MTAPIIFSRQRLVARVIQDIVISSFQVHQQRWKNTKASTSLVRLCKRMGQLDICSRREADRWIREGKVYVNGQVALLGQSVASNLPKDSIIIKHQQLKNESEELSSPLSLPLSSSESESTITAVALNKPPGYVSGQAEHGHPAAIRLLRRDRLWSDANEIFPTSWKGFAPAGRLDLESSGLLVFCSSGVLAKKIIHSNSKVDKEYIVHVSPAVQATRLERKLDPNFVLPYPTLELQAIKEGGRLLLGDDRPLKPCPEVDWLEKGEKLRIVLREGRKHHIRRACRELLGYHVVDLQRIRIGSIHLNDLPLGFWRPLSKTEINDLLS